MACGLRAGANGPRLYSSPKAAIGRGRRETVVNEPHYLPARELIDRFH